MLFNALAALGHRGIKTTATFGRAGLMLFNAVVGKPEFRKHAPLLVRQLYNVGVLSMLIIIVSGLFIGMVLGLLIQTHPLVGWDISTVDSYDALMLRLHYQNPTQENSNDAEIGQTLWLTTDVARQFISILEAGIAKIESGEYQENEYRRH